MSTMKRFPTFKRSDTTSPAAARPAHHANDAGTLFKNPWPSAAPVGWMEMMQNSFPLSRYGLSLQSHDHARQVEVVKPDWGEKGRAKLDCKKEEAIVATWLGHAGVLVEVPVIGSDSERKESTSQQSAWLLFDPIFSMRAGPTQATGPARMKESPCQVKDLPGCHVVFISHSHYDHLDLGSIKALLEHFPNAIYCVPLGNKAWLTSVGVYPNRVHELDWWQHRDIPATKLSKAITVSGATLRLSCVPAQHTSGRGVMDQNTTLWCGWVVEMYTTSSSTTSSSSSPSPSNSTSSTTDLPREDRYTSIYHAGDTGYRRLSSSPIVCPAFASIGARFGPLDLAFIPIWRGGTLGFLSSLGLRLSHADVPSTFHGTPRDAVSMHLDVRARNTVGVHFATFVGSDNESYEAMIEFRECCEQEGVKSLDADPKSATIKGRAGITDIGASLAIRLGEA